MIHMLRRHKVQLRAHQRVDFFQIRLVLRGNNHRFDSGAKGRHGLFPQPADGQHTATQGDFAGHGHIVAYRGAGQGGDQCDSHGDAGRGAVLGNCPLREMDVNIFIFVKFRVYAQHGSPAADIAQGRLGGFLHHIPQVACQFQTPGALHYGHLHVQNLTAGGGVGKSTHQAHLVPPAYLVRLVDRRAKDTLQLAGAQAQALELPLGDAAGRRTAGGGDLPFQLPHAGFPGVGADHFPDGIVLHPQLICPQAVLLPLLGQKMFPGNLDLLLVGVAGKLNDLHAVQQGPGNGVQGVGSGDKEHL